MTRKDAERQDAIDKLREWLKPGDTMKRRHYNALDGAPVYLPRTRNARRLGLWTRFADWVQRRKVKAVPRVPAPLMYEDDPAPLGLRRRGSGWVYRGTKDTTP